MNVRNHTHSDHTLSIHLFIYLSIIYLYSIMLVYYIMLETLINARKRILFLTLMSEIVHLWLVECQKLYTLWLVDDLLPSESIILKNPGNVNYWWFAWNINVLTWLIIYLTVSTIIFILCICTSRQVLSSTPPSLPHQRVV